MSLKTDRNSIYNIDGISIKILFSQNELESRISWLAEEISHDYSGRELVLVGILKGSVFFLTDLMKKLSVSCMLDFMSVSSYYDDTVSSGKINIKKNLEIDICDKDVLIVEDIIDTGLTMSILTEKLKKLNPASLKICTLLDKPSRREVNVSVDYKGFTIPDEFVVGYGLDYAQKYRELPFVGSVQNLKADN